MEKEIITKTRIEKSASKKCLVTVIVPIYNVNLYLNQCLESIVKQTYKELEIILVDDGSTDGSEIICDDWAKNDKRIIVIHQSNSGVSSARNAGLSICKGDCIIFVDSDDWLFPEMVEKMQSCLYCNEADVAMCGYLDDPEGVAIEKGISEITICDYKGAVYEMMRPDGCHTAPWGKIFRREAIFKNGNYHPFDINIALAEDEIWLLEILHECSVVAFVPETLYSWRNRPNSASRFESVTEKQLSIITAKRRSFKLLPNDLRIRRLAGERIYSYLFLMRMQAYTEGNNDAVKQIGDMIRPLWFDYISSKDIKILRKIKTTILELEMSLHLPLKLIKITDNLNRGNIMLIRG